MPLTVGRSGGFGASRVPFSSAIPINPLRGEGSSSGLTTYTFNNAGAGFAITLPGTEVPRRYIVAAAVGTGSASRTITGMNFYFDGGAAVAATEIKTANASASVLAVGLYGIDAGECLGTYTVDVTFSGAMLGAGVAFYEWIAAYNPTASELVTAGSPIVTTTYAVYGGFFVGVAAQSATTSTVSSWDSPDAGGSSYGELAVTYGSRQFSMKGWQGTATPSRLRANFSAAPSNQRLLTANMLLDPYPW